MLGGGTDGDGRRGDARLEGKEGGREALKGELLGERRWKAL